MNAEEAQRALDDIRRRDDQTRAAHSRIVCSPAAVGLLAVAVLIPFASYDLPNPWGGAMILPWAALMIGLLVVYLRRSPVRQRLTINDAAWGATSGVLLLAAFRGATAVASTAGVPAPHALAAGLVCLAGTAIAGLIRHLQS